MLDNKQTVHMSGCSCCLPHLLFSSRERRGSVDSNDIIDIIDRHDGNKIIPMTPQNENSPKLQVLYDSDDASECGEEAVGGPDQDADISTKSSSPTRVNRINSLRGYLLYKYIHN